MCLFDGLNSLKNSSGLVNVLRKFNTGPLVETIDAFAVEFVPLLVDHIGERRIAIIHWIESAPLLHPYILEQYCAIGQDLLKAKWLHPFLGVSMINAIQDWSTIEDFKLLREIYHWQENDMLLIKDDLLEVIKDFVLVNPSDFNAGSRTLMNCLMSSWTKTLDPTRRGIARWLVTKRCSARNLGFCIRQLATTSDTWIAELSAVISQYEREPKEGCLAMIQLLAHKPSGISTSGWKPVLQEMLIGLGTQLVKWILKESTTLKWTQFLADIHTIFATSGPGTSPIETPDLLQWGDKLIPYAHIIDRLKGKVDSIESIRCICFEAAWRRNIQQDIAEIMALLEKPPQHFDKDLSMQIMILGSLSWDGRNVAKVRRAISSLHGLSVAGYEGSVRVRDLLGTSEDNYVARSFLEMWLANPLNNRYDAYALKAIFSTTHTLPELSASWLQDEGLVFASNQLEAEYAGLMDEVRRLAAMRASLKAIDLEGVTELLAEAEIEDCEILEDILASFPPEVSNAVEIVGEKEVEIIFPLTHLTALQRKALGIGAAQTFVLLLELCDHTKELRAVVHVESELAKNQTLISQSTLPKERDPGAPWKNVCSMLDTTSNIQCSFHQASLFGSIIVRLLRYHLREVGIMGKDFTTLADIHELVSSFSKV